MFVLTDEAAVQHYCGCLIFHESIALHSVKSDDDDIDDESLNSMELPYPHLLRSSSAALAKGTATANSSAPKPGTMHQMMYAPKCILLISRQNYPEIIKVRERDTRSIARPLIRLALVGLPDGHIHRLH